MRQALKAIPLFKDLTGEDLDLIAALLKRISYAKGQTVFRQGDIGNAMYLVESGQVVVWDEAENEALAYLGPGSFVGEIALLLAEPRSASLKVALDANLLVLEKEPFDLLLKRRPAIAIHMTRELSQRLVNTSKQRFKPRAKHISALWGTDSGDLVRTLNRHTEKSIAVIPLPGCCPYDPLANILDVFVLTEPEITVENLAGQLGIHLQTYGHIILLLPRTVNPLARKALSLADIIISIDAPPRWIEDNVPANKIWETSNNPTALNRIARRLTGHTVGLALSQGSAKGIAHVGVIKVLRDENIPVDLIAGSSIGALFGAFLAAGWSDEQLDAFADESQAIVSKWLNWDISLPPRAGIIKGGKVRNLIAEWLGDKQFEDLDIPFSCVATDILTGEEVIFDSGNLADAIRASISLPILFNPWQVNGRYLMDGGLVNPIPANVLRAKGADIVIASNVVEALAKDTSNRYGKMPHFLKIINNVVTLAA
ncbi:MAG: patatin-like phospholipase family protein, partial [Anaerolineae bacterium]